MEQRGFTVWLTGLSGAGKTSIAERLTAELRRRGLRVELLAGSEFRQNLSQGLGFSREDRIANVRRVGYVAKLLARNGVAVVTTTVSPYREARDECRRMIGSFVEVFVDCPLEVCEQREPDGLYTRARRGELTGVAGVDEPYEAPLAPEVVLRSEHESADVLTEQLVRALEEAGWLAPAVGADESLIRARLLALQDRR